MDSHQSDHSPERTAPLLGGEPDRPGTTPGPYEDGPRRGDTDHPGDTPDETGPLPDGTDQPSRSPDEIDPDEGDVTQPGSSPDEIPPSEL